MKLEFDKAKALIPEIKKELKAAIVQFLQEPKYDYSPVSAARWSRVDTDIKHDTDEQGVSYTGIYFEIGAELDYEGMSELEDVLNPIIQKIDSDAFFEMYDPGISTCYIWYEDSEIESCQDITSAELPDYGGAFDVDPHEFFTKEECMELAQEVEDILNKDPDVPYPVQYYDVYIVDYNRIVVDLTDSQDNELSGQAKIDMRRIRVPQDLITKYGPIVADSVKEDIAYIYSDEIESSLNLDSYDDGYVEMRDGEPNFIYDTFRDAQRGVEQSRAGDSEYGMGSHKYKIMRWKNKQLQDIDESENIQSDSNWHLGSTENPMVMDDYYDEDIDEQADVKDFVSIKFSGYVEIFKNGDWNWELNDAKYLCNASNPDDNDSNEWLDQTTNQPIFIDEGDAIEYIVGLIDEKPELYSRLPNYHGIYKISCELEIPYTLSNLVGTVDNDTINYDESDADVTFDENKIDVINWMCNKTK